MDGYFASFKASPAYRISTRAGASSRISINTYPATSTPERAANGADIRYPRLTTQQSPNTIPNSFFIEDASYIRLRNAEIGYTLLTNLAKKIGAKRVRLYTNGLNLLTFDRLPTKQIDPELTGGLAYPINRLINFGVNVTF